MHQGEKMIIKIEDFTVIGDLTLSGEYECRVYKGRCLETRTQGKRMRINGYPTFLAKSIEDAKAKVREEFGLNQTKLEEFI